MTNEHPYTIEPFRINPSNINSDDVENIKKTILKHANGVKKGKTEIEVFRSFSTSLEHALGAEISIFSCPSEELNYWTLILPKDGNFDATPAKISVSFHIKRAKCLMNYVTLNEL